MMRLRRVSAIVALSLLTSAATAYSECAWVLWQQWGQTWMLEGATDSLQECERAQGERTRLLIATGAQTPRSGPGGELEARLYYCFPDTVDPRGPKGK